MGKKSTSSGHEKQNEKTEAGSSSNHTEYNEDKNLNNSNRPKLRKSRLTSYFEKQTENRVNDVAPSADSTSETSNTKDSSPSPSLSVNAWETLVAHSSAVSSNTPSTSIGNIISSRSSDIPIDEQVASTSQSSGFGFNQHDNDMDIGDQHVSAAASQRSSPNQSEIITEHETSPEEIANSNEVSDLDIIYVGEFHKESPPQQQIVSKKEIEKLKKECTERDQQVDFYAKHIKKEKLDDCIEKSTKHPHKNPDNENQRCPSSSSESRLPSLFAKQKRNLQKVDSVNVTPFDTSVDLISKTSTASASSPAQPGISATASTSMGNNVVPADDRVIPSTSKSDVSDQSALSHLSQRSSPSNDCRIASSTIYENSNDLPDLPPNQNIGGSSFKKKKLSPRFPKNRKRHLNPVNLSNAFPWSSVDLNSKTSNTKDSSPAQSGIFTTTSSIAVVNSHSSVIPTDGQVIASTSKSNSLDHNDQHDCGVGISDPASTSSSSSDESDLVFENDPSSPIVTNQFEAVPEEDECLPSYRVFSTCSETTDNVYNDADSSSQNRTDEEPKAMSFREMFSLKHNNSVHSKDIDHCPISLNSHIQMAAQHNSMTASNCDIPLSPHLVGGFEATTGVCAITEFTSFIQVAEIPAIPSPPTVLFDSSQQRGEIFEMKSESPFESGFEQLSGEKRRSSLNAGYSSNKSINTSRYVDTSNSSTNVSVQSPISPSADDLILKIQSVKKVFENDPSSPIVTNQFEAVPEEDECLPSYRVFSTCSETTDNVYNDADSSSQNRTEEEPKAMSFREMFSLKHNNSVHSKDIDHCPTSLNSHIQMAAQHNSMTASNCDIPLSPHLVGGFEETTGVCAITEFTSFVQVAEIPAIPSPPTVLFDSSQQEEQNSDMKLELTFESELEQLPEGKLRSSANNNSINISRSMDVSNSSTNVGVHSPISPSADELNLHLQSNKKDITYLSCDALNLSDASLTNEFKDLTVEAEVNVHCLPITFPAKEYHDKEEQNSDMKLELTFESELEQLPEGKLRSSANNNSINISRSMDVSNSSTNVGVHSPISPSADELNLHLQSNKKDITYLSCDALNLSDASLTNEFKDLTVEAEVNVHCLPITFPAKEYHDKEEQNSDMKLELTFESELEQLPEGKLRSSANNNSINISRSMDVSNSSTNVGVHSPIYPSADELNLHLQSNKKDITYLSCDALNLSDASLTNEFKDLTVEAEVNVHCLPITFPAKEYHDKEEQNSDMKLELTFESELEQLPEGKLRSSANNNSINISRSMDVSNSSTNVGVHSPISPSADELNLHLQSNKKDITYLSCDALNLSDASLTNEFKDLTVEAEVNVHCLPITFPAKEYHDKEEENSDMKLELTFESELEQLSEVKIRRSASNNSINVSRSMDVSNSSTNVGVHSPISPSADEFNLNLQSNEKDITYLSCDALNLADASLTNKFKDSTVEAEEKALCLPVKFPAKECHSIDITSSSSDALGLVDASLTNKFKDSTVETERKVYCQAITFPAKECHGKFRNKKKRGGSRFKQSRLPSRFAKDALPSPTPSVSVWEKPIAYPLHPRFPVVTSNTPSTSTGSTIVNSCSSVIPTNVQVLASTSKSSCFESNNHHKSHTDLNDQPASAASSVRSSNYCKIINTRSRRVPMLVHGVQNRNLTSDLDILARKSTRCIVKNQDNTSERSCNKRKFAGNHRDKNAHSKVPKRKAKKSRACTDFTNSSPSPAPEDYVLNYHKLPKDFNCPKCSFSCLTKLMYSSHSCSETIERLSSCKVMIKKTPLNDNETPNKYVCPKCFFTGNDSNNKHSCATMLKQYQNCFVKLKDINKPKVDVIFPFKGAAICYKLHQDLILKEKQNLIKSTKICSSPEDVVTHLVLPFMRINREFDPNNSNPDINLDLTLPFENQALLIDTAEKIFLKK